MFKNSNRIGKKYNEISQKIHKIKISKEKIDSIIVANSVSKEHAANFATLVVQDNGRMKPINTFASELLRKISNSLSICIILSNNLFTYF